MSFKLSLDDLLAYSDWERTQWHAWFQNNPDALAVGLGPNTDGRFANIGELARHIFSAERRYVERALKLSLSDPSSGSTDDVEALFALGRETRLRLRDFLASFPAAEWEVGREMQVGPKTWMVTPRKMILQAVTHEIRHWAQIATMLRIAGHKTGSRDLIASPIFGPV